MKSILERRGGIGVQRSMKGFMQIKTCIVLDDIDAFVCNLMELWASWSIRYMYAPSIQGRHIKHAELSIDPSGWPIFRRLVSPSRAYMRKCVPMHSEKAKEPTERVASRDWSRGIRDSSKSEAVASRSTSRFFFCLPRVIYLEYQYRQTTYMYLYVDTPENYI
jgi:hypothetical protein